jgi:hypothetical protein
LLIQSGQLIESKQAISIKASYLNQGQLNESRQAHQAQPTMAC